MKYRMIAVMILLTVWILNAQPVEEMRAVWLTNVDSYVLASDDNITEAMEYLASININVVFPVVYNKGYTLYPSAIMDSLFGQATLPDPAFQNRDYLEKLVTEAHRVGIEVIPWFEFGFSSSYSLNGGHIIEKFPDWACKNRSGNLVVKNGFDWLSGINTEVQDYMLSLIMEVIDNYDVDGVQGDDRLPAMPVEGGYEEFTVELYKSEHGGAEPPVSYNDAGWKTWRAGKLNEYFARVRDSVKSRSENLILSVAPSPYYWGYGEYLQDSKNWVIDGIVDNIIPQLYQYDLGSYNYALSTTLNDVGQHNPEIFFAGVLMNVGTYLIDKNLMGQMMSANRDNNVNGESFFFYEGLRKNNNDLGDHLGAYFYKDPAVLPWRGGNTWRPAAEIKNEDDQDTRITGSWETYPMQGYEGAVLRTGETAGYASAEYYYTVENEAWYDLFSFRTPNTPWTDNAHFVLYSGDDSTEVYVDQSVLNVKGWHKVGQVYLTAGTHKVVKLDNVGLADGKYVVADAMMLMINRRLSPGVIVSVKDDPVEEVIPAGYRLEQNYPNPFNPETTIRFYIDKAAHCRISVSDLLGREVGVLYDDWHPEGNGEVSFNANTLSSGVFFYTFEAGEVTITKKMILLR